MGGGKRWDDKKGAPLSAFARRPGIHCISMDNKSFSPYRFLTLRRNDISAADKFHKRCAKYNSYGYKIIPRAAANWYRLILARIRREMVYIKYHPKHETPLIQCAYFEELYGNLAEGKKLWVRARLAYKIWWGKGPLRWTGYYG